MSGGVRLQGHEEAAMWAIFANAFSGKVSLPVTPAQCKQIGEAADLMILERRARIETRKERDVREAAEDKAEGRT